MNRSPFVAEKLIAEIECRSEVLRPAVIRITGACALGNLGTESRTGVEKQKESMTPITRIGDRDHRNKGWSAV